MTIVLKCQECKSVQMVIDSDALDNKLYEKIGRDVCAGRMVERYNPGDTRYKNDKFRGEIECDLCGSVEGTGLPLFGEEDTDQEENT